MTAKIADIADKKFDYIIAGGGVRANTFYLPLSLMLRVGLVYRLPVWPLHAVLQRTVPLLWQFWKQGRVSWTTLKSISLPSGS